MKSLKPIAEKLNTKWSAYLFYAFSVIAAVFFVSNPSYATIAEVYPFGIVFVIMFFVAVGLCAVSSLIELILLTSDKEKSEIVKAFEKAHIAFGVLSVLLFAFSFLTLFRLDKGAVLDNISFGFLGLKENAVYLILALIIPFTFMFAGFLKRAFNSVVASAVAAAIVLVPIQLFGRGNSYNSLPLQIGADTMCLTKEDNFPELKNMNAKNLLEGAKVVFESVRKYEVKDAKNLFTDDLRCWSPMAPNRKPAAGCPDVNNSYVEIKLAKESTFNTAIIKELGNQVQYFRLQAKVDGRWKTIYEGEKIQDMKICSFDSVTTDSVRLSIDKFRDVNVTAMIRNFQLFNVEKRDVKNFEVTGYQRLDGDVPTEVLKKGEEYVNNYARYYDVYSTIIVFGAVHWDENGNIGFGSLSEEQFAREIAALKEIINHRQNKEHEVKLIVTALADGAWGANVNAYMTENWEDVADKIVSFVNKYKFDGVDIDWEYPQTKDDWRVYDKFIARLDDKMQETNPDAIVTAALSAWGLGMSKETLDRLDQIQFMAYDGQDVDGYQSSLQQAQEGLTDFIKNGADISKINIGIAVYARPINLTPYWAIWRYLDEATYWNSKYYTIHDGDQVYEGTFCSPSVAGDKTALALFSGAGGVMTFRVDCDKFMDDHACVAGGIQNALNRYVNNW